MDPIFWGHLSLFILLLPTSRWSNKWRQTRTSVRLPGLSSVLALSLFLNTQNIECSFKATIFRKFENSMAYVSTNLLICAQVIPTLINPHDCSVYSKRRRYVLENKHFQPRSLERQWGLLEDKLPCKPEFLNEEYKWMQKKK